MHSESPNLPIKLFSRISAFIVVILGATVIIGWYTKNITLLQVLPDAVAMQYNTALGFLLAGSGLFFAFSNKRKITFIIGLLLCILGVLTISEYLFDWNLGIDELFMDHYITDKVSHKGRMAPNTAFCFSLTGAVFVSLYFSNNRRGFHLIGVLGLLIISLGVFAFTGYFTEFDAAYIWGNLTKMAIHTAAGFMLVGPSILTGIWYPLEGRSWVDASITRKLSIYIIIPILAIYLILATYSIYNVKEATYEQAYLKLKEVGWKNTNTVNESLRKYEEIARSTRRFLLTQKELDANELNSVLVSNLDADKTIQGTVITFAPYAYTIDEKLYAPYVYRVKGEIKHVDIGTDSYDYTDGNYDWYEMPKKEGKGVWSEPYFDDKIENTWMITYSTPVFKDEELWAVVTIDIPLTNIYKVFDHNQLDQFDFGILSRTGSYVYTSYDKEIIGTNVFGQKGTTNMLQEDTDALAREMLKGKEGFTTVDLIGGDAFHITYNPVGSSGWVFFIGINKSKILLPVKQIILRMSFFFLIVLFLFIIVIYNASNRLAQRILKLNNATNQITSGNLDTQIVTQTNDEIGVLSQNFASMTSQLRFRENQLKSLNDKLEVKVKERTHQLEEAIEELRITQEVTKESEEKFKTLFSSSALPLCYVSNNGTIELINDQFTKVFGYTLVDTLDLDTWWQKAYPDPEYRNWALKTWEQAVENARIKDIPIESIEYHVTCKDGQVKTIVIGGTVLADSLLATFYDVTEQKTAQEKLAASELQFKTLVNNMPGLFWRVEHAPEWPVKFFSQGAKDLTGFSAEEYMEGKVKWIERTHPEDLDRLIKVIEEGVDKRETFDITYRFIRADNEIRWVREIGIYVIRGTDEVSLLDGFVFDVTEQITAEERIRESEQLFKSIVENMPGVVFRCRLTDPWEMFFISDEIEKITGYPKSDFLGDKPPRTFGDIMHPDDRADTSEKVQEAIDGHKSYVIEYRIIDRNGEIHHVHAQGQAYYKQNGAPDYIVGTIFDVTEQKKLTLQVEMERAQLKKYLDLSPIVVTITKDGVIKYVNRKSIDTFGLMPGETVDGIYIKQEDRNELLSKLQKEKSLLNHQIKYYDKDKNIIDTLLSTNAITFNDEEALLSWVVDVSDLKRIEKALKEANEEATTINEELVQEVEVRRETEEELSQTKNKMELAIKAANVGIWDWDLKNNITRFDETMFKIYGIGRNDFENLYDAWIAAIHPDDLEQVNIEVESALKGESKWDSEFRIIRPDGDLRFIRSTAVTEWDDNGNPKQMMGVNWDISNSKLAEQKMRSLINEIKAEQQRFSSMVSNVPGAIYRVYDDSAWPIIYMSDEIENITGYPASDFMESKIVTFSTIMHPDDVIPIGKKIQDQFNKGENFQVDYRIISKSDDIVWLRSQGQSVKGDKDEAWIDGVLIDITQSKESEQELAKAKEDADQANLSKSRFLANMSHEIRTPMNAILGFSELLESLVKSDVEKSYVGSIRSSGKNLLALINDILDLSKIEAGKINIDYTYFNVRNLIEEIRGIFSLKVQEKGLSFSVNIDEDTPQYILLDEIRLRQILINLISNGIKFTEAGSIKLIIGNEKNPGTSVENPRINLSIRVEDTGIGISEGFMKNLFQTFTQQDGNIAKKFGGTGLGLSISKNLAEMMNGKLLVESIEGEGSVFSLILNDVQFSDNIEQDKEQEWIDIENIVFDPATILLVDDIEDNRKYINGALRNYNFEIIEAQNGLEALAILEKINVDLILTDLRMPQMDGFTLIKQIQFNNLANDVPVIATSASVMEFNLEKAKRYKFNDFLAKPVKVNELVACFAKYLPSKMEQSEKKEIKETPKDTIIIKKSEKERFLKAIKELKQSSEKLKDQQAMEEVEAFANDILVIGQAYKAHTLIKYGESMKTAVDSFDIEEMLTLINKFDHYIQEQMKSIKESE